MTNCAVPGCSSHSGKLQGTGVVFHSFPRLAERRKKWVHVIKRKDKINFKYATVCSLHFGAEDYERDLQHELLGLESRKRRKLIETAIPTRNLPPGDEELSIQESPKDSRNTKAKRKRATKANVWSCNEEKSIELVLNQVECQLERDEVTELKTELEKWKNECEKMRSEVSHLRNKLDSCTKENTTLRVELSRMKVRVTHQGEDQRNWGSSLIKLYTSQQLSSLADDECMKQWEPEIILGH